MSPSTATRNRIRDLNDAFRSTGPTLRGRWVLTRGVHEQGADFITDAVDLIRQFDAFEGAEDPYGEHDFGSIKVHGQHLFWKIDYYDLTMSYGSENPANPAVTTRILTVMLASEY